MTEGLTDVLAELHHSLAALYDERLVDMRLFGSHARDEAEAESDIDVLVILKGPVDPAEEIARTGELVARLSLAYDAVLSCVFMAEDRYQDERSPFLLNVHRESVPV